MNPHQLQNALDVLLDGDSVNGVSCNSVYTTMARDSKLVMEMFELLHSGDSNDAQALFMREFREAARDALTEARVADMEVEVYGT
jgi:hypothetical protein